MENNYLYTTYEVIHFVANIGGTCIFLRNQWLAYFTVVSHTISLAAIIPFEYFIHHFIRNVDQKRTNFVDSTICRYEKKNEILEAKRKQ